LNALPPRYQEFIDRFVVTCLADRRVLAAFLGGSHARAAADEYSDLDLYLVTTDKNFQAFMAGKRDFLRQLGQPLFLEDFDNPAALFFILADGTEGELGIGCRSQFLHIHSGPHLTLLDKEGLLQDVVFLPVESDHAQRVEILRRQINWFWHDLSHFISAMGRGQLWWAYSQVEILRGICMNLMRLQQDFQDPEVGEEAGFKIEKALQPGMLEAFSPTYCLLQVADMLQSVALLIRIYQDLALSLAERHSLEYPAALERLMLQRWEKLAKNQAPTSAGY